MYFRSGFIGILCMCMICSALGQVKHNDESTLYGNNPAAGGTVAVNGIRMYYETYGAGDPAVVIHDNGGDIKSMQKQIPAFAARFRVIVADSRGHGRSSSDGGRITYEQMAADWTALLDSLHIDSAYVFGWGSGGTVGLLMAMNSPVKVRKLAVLGATLEPDSIALREWFRKWIAETDTFAERKLRAGDTAQNWPFMRQLLDLLGNQPHIPVENLRNITAPTLVMCGDRDVVTNEHSAVLFDHLPNAQLCIFPGATHMLPWEDSDMLNRTIINFFVKPFSRPDTKDYY